MTDTGDAWLSCRCGERHWGRHGAAGLLVAAAGAVLLQHRAAWSAHGGTWGIPGGARRAGESAIAGALRETAEETGVLPPPATLRAVSVADHGDWSYTTVLAQVPSPLAAHVADAESGAVAWVVAEQVAELPLLPAFAAAWPALRPLLDLRTAVVVDAANVVGSRPDGWWRDRPAATSRLLDSVGRWAAVPVAEAHLPAELRRAPLSARWLTAFVVVEGMPARAPRLAAPDDVRLVRAPASGDDAVVGTAYELLGDGTTDVLVVTADRALADRVRAAGAAVAGPAWLWRLLDATPPTGRPGSPPSTP
jgi:8-oxo-dGTP diphosphatase